MSYADCTMTELLSANQTN